MFGSLLHWICLCNKWSSRTLFSLSTLLICTKRCSFCPPLNLESSSEVSLDFKAYEGRRRLHPPPTDLASSVKPSDHKNAGKKENGSWWECLFLNCCRPQTVSVHLPSGTLGLPEVQDRGQSQHTHTWGRQEATLEPGRRWLRHPAETCFLQMSGWAGEHGFSPDADYSERASQMGSAHVVVDRAAAPLTIQRWNSAPNMCYFPLCYSSKWHVCCASVLCSTCFHNYKLLSAPSLFTCPVCNIHPSL